MNCSLEQSIANAIEGKIRSEFPGMGITSTGVIGEFKVKGNPNKIKDNLSTITRKLGRPVFTMPGLDPNMSTHTLKVNLSDDVLSLYMSKYNAVKLEENRIVHLEKLRARKNLTISGVFKELNTMFSKTSPKGKIVSATNKSLESGTAFITQDKRADAIRLVDNIKRKYDLTAEQIYIESYNIKQTAKNPNVYSAITGRTKGYRVKIAMSAADATKIKVSEAEHKATLQAQENRAEDLIIPTMNQSMKSEDFAPDGFNYGQHIENKHNLVEKLSKFLYTLKNKANKSEDQYRQITEVERLIMKLKKSLRELEDSDSSYNNYFTSFHKDLDNVYALLERGNVDDLIMVNDVINTLEAVTQTEPGGFLIEGTDAMLNNSNISEEDKELFRTDIDNFRNRIEVIKADYNAKRDVAIKQMLKDYILNTTRKEATEEEIETIYKDKIQDALEDISLVELAMHSIEDEIGGKNMLSSVAHNILARALTKSKKIELGQNLSGINDAVEAELEAAGELSESSFFGKLHSNVSYKSFFREFTTAGGKFNSRLASLFSSKWDIFKDDINKLKSELNDLEHAPDKTATEFAEINTLRKNLHKEIRENGHFVDSHFLPEFDLDPEIKSLMDELDIPQKTPGEKETYKAAMIAKIGEVEYNKLVEEQKNNIYEFIALTESIKEEMLLNTGVDSVEDLPAKEYNIYNSTFAQNNPILHNINFEGKSQVETKFKAADGTINTYYSTSSLKYSTFYPNLTAKDGVYKDNEFVNQISNNKTLFEAWKMVSEALEYINKNNNSVSKSSGFNSITNQVDMAREVLTSNNKYLAFLSSYTLDVFNNFFTTANKGTKGVNLKVAGGISTLESVVNSKAKIFKSTFEASFFGTPHTLSSLPTDPAVKSYLKSKVGVSEEILLTSPTVAHAITESVKTKTLDSQDINLIKSIVAQLEAISLHKAKKESEAKLQFILTKLKDQESIGTKSEKRNKAIEFLGFFIDKKVYDSRNMSDFGRMRKVYKAHEKPMNKEIERGIKKLKNIIKALDATVAANKMTEEDVELHEKAKKDLEAMERFLESKGKILAVGSILEATIFRIARYKAFYANFSAQFGNKVIGKLSAMEMDGKLWKEGNYYLGLSATRKWKTPFNKISPERQRQRNVRDLILNRIAVYQNSGNDMFDVKSSEVKNTVGKVLLDGMQLPGEVEKSIQKPQVAAILGDESIVFIKDKNGNKHPAFDLAGKDLVPAFDIIDGKLTLKEAFNTKENRETWLENSSDEFADFFSDSGSVPAILKVVNGNYSDLSLYMAESNMLSAMFFMFKRWLAISITKKYGAFSELSDAGNMDRAVGVTMQKALISGWNKGALFTGPIGGMVAGSAMVAIAMESTRKLENAKTGEDISRMQFLADAILKQTITKKFYINSARTLAGATTKAVQISVNSLFGSNVIPNSLINSISGYNDLNGTPEQIRQSQENLNYLMTSLAYSIRMTGLRLLATALVFGGDDEEEVEKKIKDYSKDIYDGKGLWSRVMDSPEMTAYYLFENYSQKFIKDANLLISPVDLIEATIPLSAENRSVESIKDLYNSLEAQAKSGNYKKGPNAGRNRIGVQAVKTLVPTVFDEWGFGFASSAKKDFTPDDVVDTMFIPSDEEGEPTYEAKIKKNWKAKRKVVKEEYEEKNKDKKWFKNLSKKEKTEELTWAADQKHPSIAKDFKEDGTAVNKSAQKFLDKAYGEEED